jgi:hypothetical protein
MFSDRSARRTNSSSRDIGLLEEIIGLQVTQINGLLEMGPEMLWLWHGDSSGTQRMGNDTELEVHNKSR